MTTGEIVRKKRKALGLSMAELGERIGVTAAAISRYELGQRELTVDTLQSIALALNVSMLELIGIEQQMNSTIFKLEAKPKDAHDVVPTVNVMSAGDIYNSLSPASKREFIAKMMEPLHVQLSEAFERLNEDGQQKAVERVEELTEIPRYRAETAPGTTPAPQEGTDTSPPADAPEMAPEEE